MNILVYGSNGWSGNQFINLLQINNLKYIPSESALNLVQLSSKGKRNPLPNVL